MVDRVIGSDLRQFCRATAFVVCAALACGGCLIRVEDEDDQHPGFLIAGQLALGDFPGVAAEGLTNAFLVPDPGVPATREGELDEDDESWHRPDGACLEVDRADFPYDGYVLVNHTDSPVLVNIIVQAGSTGMGTHEDPMLFVYRTDELPDDELSCVASDDNSYGGRDCFVQIELASRESYLIVVTSFNDDNSDTAYGSYFMTVNRA